MLTLSVKFCMCFFKGMLWPSPRLCNCFYCGAADNKIAIAKLGGIELVIQAFKKHLADKDVANSTCAALWNLAVNGMVLALFFFNTFLYRCVAF